MLRRPPRSRLFLYTTLFRSVATLTETSSCTPPLTLCSALSPPLTSALFSRLRSEEHTSELQSRGHLVCRLLLEKKKKRIRPSTCRCPLEARQTNRSSRPFRR